MHRRVNPAPHSYFALPQPKAGILQKPGRIYTSTNSDPKDETGGSATSVMSDTISFLRVSLFVVHAAFSLALIILLHTQKKCPRNNTFYTSNDAVTAALQCASGRRMLPLLNKSPNETCVASTIGKCVSDTPNMVEASYALQDSTIGGSVHPMACMCIFEFLTASFALVYLADHLFPSKQSMLMWAVGIATIWNIVFISIMSGLSNLIPYTHLLLGWGFVIVTFYIHSRYLENKARNSENAVDNAIIMRYQEYAMTASILLLAVIQVLSFAGVSAAIVQTSFAAMIVCNLLGVTLHMTYMKDASKTEQTSQNGKWQVALYLLASWLAFFTAILPIFLSIGLDLGRIIETIPEDSAKLAIYLIFSLLGLSYLSFGLVTTIMVYIPHLMGYPDLAKNSEYLADWILDVLSFTAKITIVVLSFSSDIFQPQSVNDVSDCNADSTAMPAMQTNITSLMGLFQPGMVGLIQ